MKRLVVIVVALLVVALAIAGMVVGLRVLDAPEPPDDVVVPMMTKTRSRGDFGPVGPGNFKGIDVSNLEDGGISFAVHRDKPIGRPSCAAGFHFEREVDGKWAQVKTSYRIFKNCDRYVDSGPPPTPAEEQSYCRCEPGEPVQALSGLSWSRRIVTEDNRPTAAPPGRYRFVVPDGAAEFTIP